MLINEIEGVIAPRDLLENYVGICRDCNDPVLHYLANEQLVAARPEAAQHDYWCACSNSECENHEGEGYLQSYPKWYLNLDAMQPKCLKCRTCLVYYDGFRCECETVDPRYDWVFPKDLGLEREKTAAQILKATLSKEQMDAVNLVVDTAVESLRKQLKAAFNIGK